MDDELWCVGMSRALGWVSIWCGHKPERGPEGPWIVIASRGGNQGDLVVASEHARDKVWTKARRYLEKIGREAVSVGDRPFL